jgi:putative addiction module killer protein
MKSICETLVFSAWIDGLRDEFAKAKIHERIDRLAAGNAGDVKPIGEGVSELRISYGPGYRIYFVERRGILIILLCGGDKSTQDRDIKKAKALASNIRGQI